MANDKGHRMRYRRALAEADEKQATIDALVTALKAARRTIGSHAVWDFGYELVHVYKEIDAALAMARKGG